MLERARARVTATHMGPGDVIEVLDELSRANLRAWLFGGWAVDALLGQQARKHADLDLVVPDVGEQLALQTLRRRGFVVQNRVDDREPWFKVVVTMLDRARRRRVAIHPVDVHSKEPDGWQASIQLGAQAIGLGAVGELFTSGTINGDAVPCLSARAQLVLHTGYEADDIDRGDVGLLCSRFSLPPPPAYLDISGR
jgi:lincosamide nucleotidyltransferase A/C/D/E